MKKVFYCLVFFSFYTKLLAQVPSIDLDANNSSGATGTSYTSDNCKGSRSSISDVDLSISSASNISKVEVTLLNSSIKDGTNNEKIYLANLAISDVFRTGNTPRLSISGSGTQKITITNNSNATINDFKRALQVVKYFNSATSSTLGSRSFEVKITNNSGSATATATLQVLNCDNQCSPSVIINNSFENPVVSNSTWAQFNLGTVPGWQHYTGFNAPNAGGGKVEIQTLALGFANSTPDGTNQYAEIDREVNLQQSFTSIINQKYIIRFAISHRPNIPTINGSKDRVITIEYNDELLDKVLLPASSAKASWTYLTYYITPKSTSSKIAFFADFNDTQGVLVDDFSVYAAGTLPKLILSNPLSRDLTAPAVTAGSDTGTDYVLSYHQTESDATQNINPIANPTNVSPGIYYVRLGHYACATIGSVGISVALPVVLTKFEAKMLGNENKVQINWQTATEYNHNYFLVEKQNESHQWIVLAKVLGKGNSNEIKNYVLFDESPQNGVNYYRLKQVDLNEKYIYSSVVAVQSKNSKIEITTYPNPATDFIKIQFSENINSIKLRLINIHQQEVLNKKVDNTNLVDWDIQQLSNGIYFLEIFINQQKTIQKIIKQ
jgi:hypothetical protein